jgi:hypothetical protein
MDPIWNYSTDINALAMAGDDFEMKPAMSRTLSGNAYYTTSAPGLASDSSVRSANSSTVGSPFTDPMMTMGHNEMYSQNNAPLFPRLDFVNPTIVNQDMFAQDSYHQQLSEFGADTGLGMSGIAKIPDHFVGECADLSSSRRRSPTMRLPISQPSTSSSFIATSANIATSPEHNDSGTYASPASATFAHSSPHNIAEPTFKSPATPASAYPRTPAASSPLKRRVYAHRAQHSPVALTTPSMPATPGPHQSPFFAQCSGNFMPLLESSCWFPYSQLLSFVTSFSIRQHNTIKRLTDVSYRSQSD